MEMRPAWGEAGRKIVSYTRMVQATPVLSRLGRFRQDLLKKSSRPVEFAEHMNIHPHLLQKRPSA